MKQIGILGGTFDPIHCGHLLAAERVWDELGLDEVWFMPTYVPPHKRNAPVATPEQRLRMVELAITDHPAFVLSDFELKLQGTSYTYETMLALSELFPNYRFVFIIGGDMVSDLPNWRNIEKLVGITRFAGLERAGQHIDWTKIPQWIQASLQMVPMPAIEISSTEIRDRCKHNRSVRYMVHDKVLIYMKENGLYGNY